MGLAQSTVGNEGPADAPHIEPGVRITKELLEQLSGRPRPSAPASSHHKHSSSSIMRKIEDEARGVMRRDAQLQHAFRQSRRVGDMLLKDEEQELQKVALLADDLLRREQREAVKEPPCLQERAACLQCYKSHPQDALACADQVKAYSACARRAIAGVSRSRS